MSQVPQPIDWVPGASMMIRRTVVDSIGGFDENYFLYFEETDFCFRAKKAGFSTWYVPREPRHAYCRTEHKAHQSAMQLQDAYRPIGSSPGVATSQQPTAYVTRWRPTSLR